MLITRFVDFWLMGGASVLLWLVLCLGQGFRYDSEPVQAHFLRLAPLFAALTLFCNHPHFMISYRFGYGRGIKFMGRHWIRLLAVPLGLFAAFALAYFRFDTHIGAMPAVLALNGGFERLGLQFRLGTLPNLGTEILSFTVLLMNLTVGWHYSKQVFGCMMVYAKFDAYVLTRVQRLLIKASLFSVAYFNFFYLTIFAPEYHADSPQQSYFFNIPLVALGLPRFLIPLSAVVCGALAIAVIVGVVMVNWRRHARWPSPNFLVAWVAFFVWWIPVVRQTEFYFLAIPFFHSLQYLPFAYRLEGRVTGVRADLRASLKLAGLLAIGFAAFELVPSVLDRWLGTYWSLDTWFFMIAFAVFINVHHFFIDSVVWKFEQKEVRTGLFKAVS